MWKVEDLVCHSILLVGDGIRKVEQEVLQSDRCLLHTMFSDRFGTIMWRQLPVTLTVLLFQNRDKFFLSVVAEMDNWVMGISSTTTTQREELRRWCLVR